MDISQEKIKFRCIQRFIQILMYVTILQILDQSFYIGLFYHALLLKEKMNRIMYRIVYAIDLNMTLLA